MLEQAGGLHGVIRLLQLILKVFIKFGNLDVYGWIIFVDYFLNFNICKHSIFVIMIIALGWIVELEQTGGLHGAIKWFTFILEVFTIFWKFGWICFELYLLITFWTLILVSILYCDYDNCIERIVVLEQAGDLYGFIRRFTFILGVFIIFWNFGCCWVMVVNYVLDLILVSILYCYINNCFVVDCLVVASEWLTLIIVLW